MDISQREIIDGHVHFPHYAMGDSLMAIMGEAGVGSLAVVCTPDERRLSLVPDAFHLKGRFPERVYVFGGLDISPLFMASEIAGEAFAHNVDVLREMGADGVKMIEGKAMRRRRVKNSASNQATAATAAAPIQSTSTPAIPPTAANPGF